MKYFTKTILFLSLLSPFLDSCAYDKFEKHKPKPLCDTANVTYSNTIKGIMDQNCNTSCHAGPFPTSGINLDSYAALRNMATTGKLYSSVVWDGKASRMPQGATTKIDTCSIAYIKKWIDSNYPQ
jgi:hypothetical protein